MPRGRPKMIGPLLPKGGYKSLNTKKALAAKAAAWDSLSTNMVPTAIAPKPRRKAIEAQLAALAKGRATRAAKKMYAPSLPKGGYKSLSTKKRLAAKAAAWDAISPVVMNQPSGNIVSTVIAPNTRRKATEAQLAALAKSSSYACC